MEGTEEFVATDYEERSALGSKLARAPLAVKERGGAGWCYLSSQRSGGSEIPLDGRSRHPQPSLRLSKRGLRGSAQESRTCRS